ncbi:class I SAM-dependent methyltransferase [Pseudoroseomonas cervicalis]|uniref:class I SAM-dependent methyltransferase n=1 Tax=Teichococcus cervicalis TaxID=204525 RepID=UPI0027829091|nr:class I SAM-dependent methyltransferase [Pseudoroseomonas cervicalis]MDQ1078021.1 hypothetical protein [Pseudoroseomonas cervicalis]
MSEYPLRKKIFEAAQGLGESWHQAGNLPARVLDFIWNALDLQFPDGPRLTVETGCGLSTILLNARSRQHVSFTIGGDVDDSLGRVQASEMFDGANTKFVLGPSQATLHDFKGCLASQGIDPELRVDFALIDGAHAYPCPELDYWHIYPYLNSWGLLAVDDIHIPTIHRLYEFLRADDMFDFYAVVENTAFFVRNASPMHDPYLDYWDRQGFNRKALGLK